MFRKAAAAAACLVLAPLLRAEEAAVLPSSGTLTCDYLEYRSSESAVVGRGHAVLLSSGTRLEADHLHLDLKTNRALATGHVYLEDGETSMLAEEADYAWGASTGSLRNGYIQDPPWRFWGRRIVRKSPDRYEVKRAAVTNCDLDPPHFHFRGRTGRYAPRKRATVYGGGLALGNDLVFFTPWYTRSLKDRRWSLRVDPGQNARDGFFFRSMFGYPVTDNTYAKVYWDHFSKTGEGVGAEYGYYRPDVKGSLYSYRIEDRLAETERWNFRAGHWQQLRPSLALQANAAFQSDADFNNQFFRDELERVRQKAESDVALTYQRPNYSSRISFEQDQIFDAAKNRFVRQKTVLPQLGVQSSPLQMGRSDVYATMSGNLRNEYVRPQAGAGADPLIDDKDRFRQTADASLDFSRRIALTKKVTLKPSVGMTEQWQSWRDLGATRDPEDAFNGTGFTRMNLRQRVTSRLDYDLNYGYRVRWTPNQFKRDHAAADKGLLENGASLFLSYRPGRKFWMRAGSGYDFRTVRGVTIRSPREKITPPTAEMSFAPARNLSFFYRQSFLLFPARRPQLSQFSVQAGRPARRNFGTSFSYNVGNPHQLQVRHTAGFALTKGWWADGGVQYNARGPGRTTYDSVQFIEKFLILKRDLHCWRARAEIRQRPGVEEIFFRVDLKTDVAARNDLAPDEEEQFYPGREREE